MRVYLPSTLPALAALLRTGEIGPPPVHGFAVTPALREWYSSGDVEELEYVALMHAARDSLRLLAADPSAPQRRVVLAADLTNGLAGGQEIGPDDPALVKIAGPIPLRDIVSAHVDDPSAVAAIGGPLPRCLPPTPATTTPGSWWTAPRDMSCSGTPPRRSLTCWPDLLA